MVLLKVDEMQASAAFENPALYARISCLFPQTLAWREPPFTVNDFLNFGNDRAEPERSMKAIPLGDVQVVSRQELQKRIVSGTSHVPS